VMPHSGNSISFVFNRDLEYLTSHCGTPSARIVSSNLHCPSFWHALSP
jgi:hypothetical protein